MPNQPKYSEALAPLHNHQPKDYFHGVYSNDLCVADNIVVFLRTEKAVLKRRNFESRPHHRYVLIVCIDTDGTINVDGRTHSLHSGSAFLIKPYQFHFYLEIMNKSLTWLFITFETKNPAPFESFANSTINIEELQIETAVKIATEFHQWEKAPNLSNELLPLASSTLLNQIRNLAQNQSIIKASSSSGYEIIEQVNHILENQLDEITTIKQLAVELAISESHLRKRFKDLTGLSLGSHLLHYKLNNAVKLLVHSKESLTQISLACGYESLAAFSRSFKTKLGITPSQYRRTSSFSV